MVLRMESSCSFVLPLEARRVEGRVYSRCSRPAARLPHTTSTRLTSSPTSTPDERQYQHATRLPGPIAIAKARKPPRLSERKILLKWTGWQGREMATRNFGNTTQMGRATASGSASGAAAMKTRQLVRLLPFPSLSFLCLMPTVPPASLHPLPSLPSLPAGGSPYITVLLSLSLRSCVLRGRDRRS